MQVGSEIFWWRRVASSIDFPYKGKIIKVGDIRLTVSVEDAATGKAGVVRHVSRERVQLVGEYCTKAEKQGPALLCPASEWGTFTRYTEVAEDLRTQRQVDLFENGNMLRYDREHWVDGYGMLGDARINRNRLAGPWGKAEEVPKEEFQSLWVEAGTRSLWKRQVETSRSAEMGQRPIWLVQSGWRPSALG
jgi:hypothetical protein